MAAWCASFLFCVTCASICHNSPHTNKTITFYQESIVVNTEVPNPSELPEGSGPRRYMGRPEAEGGAVASQSGVRTEGFGDAAEIWLHIPPNTQALIWVEGLGQSEGKEINTVQRADIERVGWCEEVAYHAGYDQYWKMPSFGAIMAMPKHYKIPMPLSSNKVQVRSKLVLKGEARGFWMRVRLRSEEEAGQDAGQA